MIKRPKRGETEEDILRMQDEFFQEKIKNPNLQPAAQIVKLNRAKQSLFAKSRKEGTRQNGKLLNDSIADKQKVILGSIVEKQYEAPKNSIYTNISGLTSFPNIHKSMHQPDEESQGKSLFALSLAKIKAIKVKNTNSPNNVFSHQRASYSILIDDAQLANEIHEHNLELLQKSSEIDILAEQKNILATIDPSLIDFLKQRRQNAVSNAKSNSDVSEMKQKRAKYVCTEEENMECNVQENVNVPKSLDVTSQLLVDELLQRSNKEKWVHFDIVEKDKLEWIKDISDVSKILNPGEQFEARFDWKGILLPHNLSEICVETRKNEVEVGLQNRDLFLHGDEPHRPGYTLQELFRLARSTVMQQRISAFGAIGGILNLYNQGFYDNVLDLPISKIFFLLRFGFDDNTTAVIEPVAKAISYLFYNSTDEDLLDFIYDNPNSYWQPALEVMLNENVCDDSISTKSLQKQFRQLKVRDKTKTEKVGMICTTVEDSDEETTRSLNDFELAETDLIECLLRTNIIQRIYYIFQIVRPDNTTVESLFKILIRIARTNNKAAMRIINDEKLLMFLWDYFLSDVNKIDITSKVRYNFPHYLFLKLIRILIGYGPIVARKLLKMKLIEKLQNILYNRDDLKGSLIKVQIESLRIIRCLMMIHVDNKLYSKFLPAFCYMLDWHFNHAIFEVGGPFLIRQHAAALLAAISTIPHSANEISRAQKLLVRTLEDCCCKWFYKATQNGIEEFSQGTLLAACLDAITHFSLHNCGAIFHNFIHSYLKSFVNSERFLQYFKSILSTSIIRQHTHDRRNAHTPLPNAGSISIKTNGPHLIVSQSYPIFFLQALWKLSEQLSSEGYYDLAFMLEQPDLLQTIRDYLQTLQNIKNYHIATNFFATAEHDFLFNLLCSNNLLDRSELLCITYKFVCCLTRKHIGKIEKLFDHIIFNEKYIELDQQILSKWRNIYMQLINCRRVLLTSDQEIALSWPVSEVPVLDIDWPYFFLKIILDRYLKHTNVTSIVQISEREILEMTLTLTSKLEEYNSNLKIVDPTEKLMYLMIAFLGQESLFLDPTMQKLLKNNIVHFFEEYKDHTFQLDNVYEGKCKFENIYALFVDHYQAASYGNELFGSLLLLPLAQKYDNKWRRRVWSDYSSALTYLNCDESLLIGGIAAYLEPCEQDLSLLKEYDTALKTNLIRPNTIPYRIAKHHIERFRNTTRKLSFSSN